MRHRLVVDVQPRVEQLAHARLDGVRQLARDDDEGFLGGCRHGRLGVGSVGGMRAGCACPGAVEVGLRPV